MGLETYTIMSAYLFIPKQTCKTTVKSRKCCNKKYKTDDVFCSICGSKIETQVSEKIENYNSGISFLYDTFGSEDIYDRFFEVKTYEDDGYYFVPNDSREHKTSYYKHVKNGRNNVPTSECIDSAVNLFIKDYNHEMEFLKEKGIPWEVGFSIFQYYL